MIKKSLRYCYLSVWIGLITFGGQCFAVQPLGLKGINGGATVVQVVTELKARSLPIESVSAAKLESRLVDPVTNQDVLISFTFSGKSEQLLQRVSFHSAKLSSGEENPTLAIWRQTLSSRFGKAAATQFNPDYFDYTYCSGESAAIAVSGNPSSGEGVVTYQFIDDGDPGICKGAAPKSEQLSVLYSIPVRNVSSDRGAASSASAANTFPASSAEQTPKSESKIWSALTRLMLMPAREYQQFPSDYNIAFAVLAAACVGAFGFWLRSVFDQRISTVRSEHIGIMREGYYKAEIDRLLRANNKAKIEKEAQATQNESAKRPIGSGGYIIVDMPDNQKSMFHDVLKGFEEFAQLKGYSIRFSIDSSVSDQIAFKFTTPVGNAVSQSQLQNDIEEYIRRVRAGDLMEDLPVLINWVQHNSVLLVLQNRLNFINHSYQAQKNVIAFYERVLKGVSAVPPIAHNIYLHNGNGMINTNYTASGSNNVAQGQNNQASHNVVDQGIHIAESFNEKKKLVDNLDQLIAALIVAFPTSTITSKSAILNLEKVRDELATEKKPDPDRTKKWLAAAEDSIKALSVGKDVFDLASKTFSGFQMPF